MTKPTKRAIDAAAKAALAKSKPRKAKGLAGLPGRLRDARTKKGLTLAELASKAGCAENTVLRLERSPPAKVMALIEKLARALGVSPGWLAGWEE